MHSASQTINVLFLPSWYPSENDFSNGIFIKRHVQDIALTQKAIVTVLSVHNTSSNGYFVNEKIDELVKEIRVYYESSSSPFSRLYSFFKAYYLGLRYLKSQNYKADLLHVHVAWRAGIIALILNYIWKTPIVLTEHWSGYQPQDGRYSGFLIKSITKKLCSRSVGITTISEDLANAMMAHELHGNYTVIGNAADPELFLPSENKENIYVHVSNFVPEKQPLEVIKAFSKVVIDFPESSLVMIGFGPLLDDCKKLVIEKKLSKYVIFTGLLQPKEVSNWVAKSKALVLFSKFEGLPCVMIESWMCGVPVITTPVGGIPEVFNHNLGVLVESETELYQAFMDIETKKLTFDAQIIRQYALHNFTPSIIGNKFIDFYQSVLEQRIT